MLLFLTDNIIELFQLKVLQARKDEDRGVNHGVQFEDKPHKVTIK